MAFTKHPLDPHRIQMSQTTRVMILSIRSIDTAVLHERVRGGIRALQREPLKKTNTKDMGQTVAVFFFLLGYCIPLIAWGQTEPRHFRERPDRAFSDPLASVTQ